MATNLTGLKVKDTYNSLLKIGDNSSLSATPDKISDGLGNESILYLSTSQVSIGTIPATGYDLTVNSATKTGSLDVVGAATAASLRLTGGSGSQGTLSWNTDEETVDIIQNGAVLQLGQEIHVHVKNQTGSTINDGTPVYVTGTLGSSGRLTVAPMIADGSIEAKYFLGVTTEDIPNGEDGKVTTFGKIRGLDTTAYTEGQTLYVSASTAGYWQTTAPVAPNLDLEVAIVINVSANNGTIFVRAQQGHYLGMLHDVYISSPANNQFLVYNSTTSRWENQGIASVGSINLDTVTDNGNTTTNDISVGDITAGNMTLSGYLRGAANFVIDPAAYGDETGVVQILGDLRVDGTTTTINSTTVTIDDKNIVLASGSATAADANGAGITIDGASATMTYNSTSDRFVFNKDIETDLVGNVTGDLTGNADTASALETARNIAVDGAVTGNADFDGSANITITTSVNHNHDDRYYTETESDTRFVNVDGDTMTDDLNFDSGSRVRLHSGTFTDANDRYEIFATGDVMFLQYYDDDQGNGTSLQKVVLSLDGTTSQREATLFGDLRLKSGNVASPTYDAVVLDIDKVNGHVDITNVRNGSFSGDLTATTNLIVGTTNVYDNLPTGALSFTTTDNRLKFGVVTNQGNNTNSAIDDIVLAESMDADYIPYVSSAGGNGDTVNAVLSQSWLKQNSDTLEIGNVSDPFSVDSKIIKVSRQIAPNEKQITEFKAQGVFVTSTTATYGTKNSSLQFYTNGRLNVNGAYTLPEGDGTSGQVLSTNGSGDLSWVAAGGPTTSDLQDVTDNGNTTTNQIEITSTTNEHLKLAYNANYYWNIYREGNPSTGDLLFTTYQNGTTTEGLRVTTSGKLVISRGTTEVQSAHDLYIGGSGLAGADSAIYIGNAGDGTGYGWEFYYAGTGSGNNNRLQIKSENLGSPVTALDIYQDGTFVIPNSVSINQSTAPLFPLHVSGKIYATTQVQANVATMGAYGGYAMFGSNSSTTGIVLGRDGTNYDLVVDSSGQVGIGTTTPSSPLHVADDGVGPTLYLGRTSGQPTIKSDGTADGHLILDSGNDSTGVWLQNYTTGKVYLATGGGSVGVGTTSIYSKLGVTASSHTNGFSVNRAANTTACLYIGNDGSNTPRIASNNADMTFGRDLNLTWTEYMRIQNGTGNVGIDNTSPTYKLDVNGNIRVGGVGESLLFDTTGAGASNGIRTINDYETVIYNGRGAAGFAVLGNSSIRLGFGTSYTAAQSSIYIPSSGYVGIGTSSPDQRLEVAGNAHIDYSLLGRGIRTSNRGELHLNATGATDVSEIMFGYGDGYTESQIRWGISDRGTTDDKLKFYKGPANGGWQEIMVIDASDNRVGINTSTPSSSLQVSGDTYVTGEFSQGVTNANKIYNYGSEFRSSGASIQIAFGRDGNNVGSGAIGADSSFCLSVWNTASTVQRMVVTQAGLVGIGTTSPTDRLHVDSGNIRLLNSMGAAGYFDQCQLRIATNNTVDTTGWQGMRFETSTAANYGWSFGANRSGNGRGSLRFYEHIGSNLGAERFTIQQDGNVGVGVSNPSNKLHVYSSDNEGIYMQGTGGGHWFNFKSGTSNLWSMGAQSGLMGWYNRTNSSYKMVITDSGSVGINTTSPSYTLDVAGSGRIGGSFTGTEFRIEATDTAGAPASTATIRMVGYEGRGIGTFYQDVSYAGEWFAGLRYSGGFANYQIGYDASTGQSEYAAKSMMTITNGGRVGIGTSSPNHDLTVSGNAYISGSGDYTLKLARISGKPTIKAETDDGGYLIMDSNGGYTALNWYTSNHVALAVGGGNVGIGYSTVSYKLDVNGTIRATGDVIAYSDARVKENVKTIDNALDKVTKLRGVSYNKIGETEEKIGVIAQEIEKVLPQVVQEDEEGMKSVAYGNIVGVLIEAIKEQQKQIDELKARLDGSTY